VALACRYWRDPKFAKVSDEAELLWLRGLAYSGEQETDGKVPRNMLESLRKPAPNPDETPDETRPKRATTLARQLVRAGLWIEDADGFAVPFNTWSRWQETAEQKTESRRKQAEKVARWRARNQGTTPSRNQGSDLPAVTGVGAGVGHSPLPPAPLAAAGLEIEVDDPEPEPVPMSPELAARFDAVTNVLARRFTNGQPEP
jgi:hypothetical protein